MPPLETVGSSLHTPDTIPEAGFQKLAFHPLITRVFESVLDWFPSKIAHAQVQSNAT